MLINSPRALVVSAWNSSFYSSEVKVYTDNELPPVGTLGGQEDMQFNKPSAVIQQVSVHENGLMQQDEEEPLYSRFDLRTRLQVVMKAMVHPYRKEALVMTDAFRGPMASAFKLHLEDIMLFQDPQRFVSVHNIQHPF